MTIVEKKSDSLWWLAQKQLVYRMHREGVNIMSGTDCACEGGLPGYSLHDELLLLVEAGLSAFAALQSATINPAKYFRMTDSLGTVERGKRADIVVLNANPLTDIRNTQNIYAVIINGSAYTSGDLERLKEQVQKINAAKE